MAALPEQEASTGPELAPSAAEPCEAAPADAGEQHAWELLGAAACGRLVRCLPLAALLESRCASRAWRKLGRGSSIVEELWQRDVDAVQRGAAWKALLLDGLSLRQRATHDSYESLCQTPSSYDAVIGRDIGRTLPREDLFREKCGKGQNALFRLLRALAVHLWDIGYVQSLNFVVATLIGVFPDDEGLVFHCAQALLFRHALADFYRPRFPKLGVTVWQFDKIVEGFLPRVHAALQGHGVTAEYYAMQWFLTLFASDLTQPVVRRVWDRFLIAGWQVMVQVGLALLRHVQEELLTYDSCEVLTFLKKFVRMRQFQPEELLRAAGSFEVSHRMLSELEVAYGWEDRDDTQLVIDTDGGTSDEPHRTRWQVRRRARPSAPARATASLDAAGGATPTAGCKEAPLQQALGQLPVAASQAAEPMTMLPFLLHNLDTGQTTLMEKEWGEFVGKADAAAPSPQCRQDLSNCFPVLHEQRLRTPATGGSFWLESRQRQALKALGKV